MKRGKLLQLYLTIIYSGAACVCDFIALNPDIKCHNFVIFPIDIL
jgi:hypothetical protein